MRQWQCKCGNLLCFGSDSPKACQVCEKCGTTALRGIDGDFVESEEHEWKQQYDRNTGKPSRKVCVKCYAREKETE